MYFIKEVSLIFYMDKGSTKILKGVEVVEGVEGVDEFHTRISIPFEVISVRKSISSELKQISKETLENPNYGT